MKFTAIKHNGQLRWDDPSGRAQYIRRLKDGSVVNEVLTGVRDSKSTSQNNYYRGVLWPAIHKQLYDDGHTMRVEAFGLALDVPITKEWTHAAIKGVCGCVGESAKRLDTGIMDRYEMSKFIDNVIRFAGEQLSMDVEALEARRP